MTKQEAKANLEVIREHIENPTEEISTGIGITSLTAGIEALEKQIPKKPIECTDLYPSEQYECPNCGYCVGHHKYMKQTHFGDVLVDCKVEFNYCGNCGQHIDWSVEE